MSLALGLLALPVHAAPGDLDTTFGTGGKVTTPIGTSQDFGYSVALQSDGKIIVAGYSISGNYDFALARYLASGALDSSFGTGGKVSTPIGTGDSGGQSVALQNDGKIVVAGYSNNGNNNDFALMRYTTNGVLDSSFGTGGKVTTPIGLDNDYGYSVAVQSNGEIVVAGYSYNGSNYDFALVRYTANGVLDSSFGTGGKVTTPIGSSDDYGSSVAVQSDGKIVVAGYSSNGTNYDFALVRYGTNGVLDTSFGTAGKVTTPIGPDDDGQSVALQSDGKIVVAGFSNNGNNYDFALVRYTTNGVLDPTFGTGGKVTTPIGTSDDYGLSVAVQSDGKIVVAGSSYNGANNDFALARYTTNGAPDATFGAAGKVTTPIGSSDDFGRSVAVQSDGKIVVVGYYYNAGGNYDFALVRYLGDPLPEIVVEQPAGTALTDGSAIIDFGTVPVGSSSAARTFTIRNTGGADLTLDAFNTDGPNPSDFAVNTNDTATTLPPGGSTTFTVTFTPGGSGTRTAALQIANNDSDENPFDVTLRGNVGAGNLDLTFGAGGKVTTPIGSSGDIGQSVAVQSDGKIVVAGFSYIASGNRDVALARYSASGALDASFGTGGKVTTPIGGSDDVGQSVAVQSDGRIVVAGYSYNTSFSADFALVRYTTNGALDASFGTGGKVITPIGPGDDSGQSVALQNDGKIVVTGFSSNGTNNDFALVRYTTNGVLDSSFGTGGKVTTPVGPSDDYGWSVAVQSDGKIVVAGSSQNGNNTDFALVRYTASGALDASFGTGGKVTTPIGPGDDYGWSVAVQSDGKIVVAGYSYNGNADFALVRYTTNGTLDATFGTAGKVTTPIGPGDDYGQSVAVQSDGKIVVAGYSVSASGNADFALVRYLGDAPEIAVEQPVGTDLTDGSAVVDFGTVPVGSSSAPKTLTIRNAGTADLTLGAFSKDGANPADFIVNTTGSATTVPAGGSTTFTITFSPGGSGTRTAALHIANNDSDENPFDLTLKGNLGAGNLDATFGTAGKVTTPVGANDAYGQSVALQSDGKIVVAGYCNNSGNTDFALARYLASGALDPTFGIGGKVVIPIGADHAYGQSVALQSDGKIVLAGYCDNSGNTDFALARYKTNGTLDTTFGTSGIVTTDFGSSIDVGWSVAVQGDGKIVVAGYFHSNPKYDFALVRYLANGTLDTSFGAGGKVTTGFGNDDAYGLNVAVQNDGKIVVAGFSDNGNRSDFALARYLANGALDSSFGTDGRVATAFGNDYAYGFSVAVQDDGKIVVAGYSLRVGGNYNFTLARYLANGVLDSSFGTAGKVITAVGSGGDSGQSVAMQGDGKIVVAGWSSTIGTSRDFALVRYMASGDLDPSFGVGGKVITPLSVTDDCGQSVALQSDGKVIVAGWSRDTNGISDFALVRYIADPFPSLKIRSTGAGQATISWTPVIPGFLLEETLTLSPANWTNTPTGETNLATLPAQLPAKFYRLHKP